MARIDPSRFPLLMVAGGFALGGVLAAATPTRMLDAPEPAWRQQHLAQPRTEAGSDDTDAGSGWFSAVTYEVLPAARFHRTYEDEAVPPPVGHFADEAQWTFEDAPPQDERTAAEASVADGIAADDEPGLDPDRLDIPSDDAEPADSGDQAPA